MKIDKNDLPEHLPDLQKVELLKVEYVAGNGEDDPYRDVSAYYDTDLNLVMYDDKVHLATKDEEDARNMYSIQSLYNTSVMTKMMTKEEFVDELIRKGLIKG